MREATSSGGSDGRDLDLSSVARIMAWEFWSLSRFRLIAAWIGLGAMNALFYHLVSMNSDSLPAAAQLNLFVAIFFSDTILIVFFLILSREFDHGKALDARAFLLPLPTWQLVLSKMIFPAAAASVLWLGVSAITRAVTPGAVTGEHWPMLGPALVAAMFTTWGLALFWLPLRPKALKLLVAIGLLAGPMTWTAGRFSDDSLDQANTMWVSPTLDELGALALFLLAGYVMAVFGAARARQGASLGFSGLLDLFDADRRVGSRSGTESRAQARRSHSDFRSPQSAQTWFEWRQKGWVIPLLACLGLFTLAFLAGVDSFLMVLPKGLKFFSLLMPVMIGCMMGRFSQSSHEASIDVFRASRPLRDTHLAHSILKAGGLSLLATWVAALAAFVVILAGFDLAGAGDQLRQGGALLRAAVADSGWTDVLLGLAGFLLVSWTNMALVTSIFLTGRNKLIATLVFFPYALGAAAFAGFKFLQPETITRLFIVAAWSLSVASLLGTAVAFLVARRRGLISRRLPGLALAAWLAACLVMGWQAGDQVRSALESGTALESALVVLGPGLLALAVAPWALAPLALSWNRHR